MNNPVWIDERGKIIEPEYCRDFLSRHPIRCINDRFYTVEGPLPDESKLKRTIYEEISPWLHAKVAQTVEQIIKALKLAAYTDPLPLQCDRIHVANGTCFLDGTFTEEKEYCSNRLSVSYRADAPAPEHWLRFLSELLESEDILALQEYLGYCLLPSTKGQKMLMLIGKGGEGVPFPVSWTVKMKKKQKETQDILSYHTQAAGCSDKARAKASGGRQPIEECGRTGL